MTTAVIVLGILSLLASVGLGIYSGVSNKKAVEESNRINQELTEKTNLTNLELQQQANEASSAEAERNREFQLMMSSTAHQREVSDLKAAGLNPILSANSGASTSSGAVANLGSAQMQSPYSSAAKLDLSGVTTALNSLTNLVLVSQLAKAGHSVSGNKVSTASKVPVNDPPSKETIEEFRRLLSGD